MRGVETILFLVVLGTVVAAFVTTLLTGIWSEGKGLLDHLMPIAGLVLGGLPSAAVAGFLVKRAPRKPMTFAVALLVITLSSYELISVSDLFTSQSAAEQTTSTPSLAGMTK